MNRVMVQVMEVEVMKELRMWMVGVWTRLITCRRRW